MNAHLLLSIAACIAPDQEIITFGDKRLTYEQLSERTGRLAASLESYGVGPGVRVGVISTNCPEMVETFFAAMQLGAAVVPINYRAKADELEYVLQDSGVKVLVVEKRYADIVAPLLQNSSVKTTVVIGGSHAIGPDYDSLLRDSEDPLFDCADVNENDLAILMYTSGTTARPKGVMISFAQLTSYVMSQTEPADGNSNGATLMSGPGYHIAGVTGIFISVYSGRRLIMLPQFDAEEWLAAVAKERPTHAFLVPTMLKRVMDHPNFSKTDFTCVGNLSYGAAPMPMPVLRRAIEAFPSTTGFTNAFGMTETTSTVAVLGPEDHRLTGTPEEVAKKTRRLASVGKPLPGVQIIVMDDNGKELGVNEIGNVYIATERAMKAYWNRPEATHETLIDGWVNTRDMGWVDEDGYLFLSGRASDMIIRGGENISPAEVEAVLLENPAVADVAVIGVIDLEWGEEVMAVVVPYDPSAPPTAEEIISFCQGRLASFKRPSRISFVQELPRTASGKILKRVLREQFQS